MSELLYFGFEQFRALRSEIDRRSSAQLSLIQLNVSGVGIIAGAFLSEISIDARILFIIPVISPMLGLLWLDNAVAIRKLGLYIQDALLPFIVQHAGGAVPNYESYVRKLEKDRIGRGALLGLPVLVIFGVIPLLALLLPFLQGTLATMKNELFIFAFPGMTILAIFCFFWYNCIFCADRSDDWDRSIFSAD